MFNKKYVGKPVPTSLSSDPSRYVSVGNNLDKLPPDARSFFEFSELRNSLNTCVSFIDELKQRLEHVESYLDQRDLDGKIQNAIIRIDIVEDKLNKILTSQEELALKMTSPDSRVRAIAEEIVNIKKQIGVINDTQG